MGREENLMPPRSEIKPKVIKAIAKLVQKPEDEVKENDRLWEDLDMGPASRKAMAKPYTEISMKYPAGKRISMASAGALKTVKESVDLVLKKANGD